MNDLQFKKQLQTAPFQLDEEMRAYLQKHPELNKTVKNSQQWEKQIKNALKIDPPEGLEARILLKQSYSEAAEKKISPPVWDQKKQTH